MTAKAPGLTSPYRGMPYVSTNAWKPCVKRVVRMNDGGVCLPISSTCTIGVVSVPDRTAARASAAYSSGSSFVGTCNGTILELLADC